MISDDVLQDIDSAIAMSESDDTDMMKTDELIPEEEPSYPGMLKAPTVPSPGSKTYTKISYAKIKSVAGTASTLATLASVIIGIISLNYEIPGMVNTVLGYISNISGFTSLVAKGESNHGIKVNLAYTVKTVKGTKRAVWKVTGVSKY